jgi:hypothetical protein
MELKLQTRGSGAVDIVRSFQVLSSFVGELNRYSPASFDLLLLPRDESAV